VDVSSSAVVDVFSSPVDAAGDVSESSEVVGEASDSSSTDVVDDDETPQPGV
jgi:hypothetical protein